MHFHFCLIIFFLDRLIPIMIHLYHLYKHLFLFYNIFSKDIFIILKIIISNNLIKFHFFLSITFKSKFKYIIYNYNKYILMNKFY